MNALSIERAAREAGASVALVIDGGTTHDFADLAARARAFASAIDGRLPSPVPAAVTIAIVAEPRLETLVGLYACWERGWCPLLVHPRLTPIEREQLLADARPTLVADASLSAPNVVATAPRTTAPDDDETACAIVYTSGTTAGSKGVVLSRRAFLASAHGSERNLGWREDDRWLLGMPLAHVGGLSVVTRALLARRTYVLATLPARETGKLVDVIARHRVTLASLVPTSLRKLLDDAPGYRFPAHVRTTLVGGAAASAALLDLARERGVPALSTYGMTETCSQIATQTYGTQPSIAEGCGPPLDGVRVRIEAGEIQVAGRALMSGYLASGGEGLLRDPFVDDGWFPTGDLGEIDERGRIHVVGRKKELIVTGAENVHPSEVERALEAGPDVAAACAFGVADETWGEIVAVAIVAKDPAITDDELFARVASLALGTLASHRRPRLLARLADLPANASGKVDRAKVRDATRAVLRRV